MSFKSAKVLLMAFAILFKILSAHCAGASCFNNFQHKANSIKENYFFHDFSMITESIEGERAVFDLPPKVVDVGRKADW